MVLTPVQEIFLHILMGAVKSLLENDTQSKNLTKYTSFQWPSKNSGHFLTHFSRISSEN